MVIERPNCLAAHPCGHEELIKTLEIWSQAYPLAVFPEPPPGEHGATVDACSARMGRHVVERLLSLVATQEDTDGT